MKRVAARWLFPVFVSWGCSAGGESPPLDVGTDGTGGRKEPGGTGGSPEGSGGLSLVGGDAASRAFAAHIERDGVRVDFVTLRCDGECADVAAVATGGEKPYSFAWEDGSANPRRRVCPTSSTRYEVTVTDAGVSTGEVRREPVSTRASLTANLLDCKDGGSSPEPDAGPACVPGVSPSSLPDTVMVQVTSPDTIQPPAPVYFAAGADLPSGRYRITYLDGCFQVTPFVFGWIAQHDVLDRGVWVVSGSTSDKRFRAPPRPGSHPTFQACVAAGRDSPPIDFDFGGGKLGVWLNDSPYNDNVAGEGGVNPTFRLEFLCPLPNG